MNVSQNKKHFWLYVLVLSNGKYYVGKTSRKDPYDRIDEHFHSFYSAQWVKKNGFLDVKEVIDIGATTDYESDVQEQNMTLKYMKKFGYNNVRGGTLNYSGKYRKVGNRYFRDSEFSMLIGIVFMTFVILYQAYLLYI